MDGATWPEQDAVDRWWQAHSLELKKAVTRARVERERELVSLPGIEMERDDLLVKVERLTRELEDHEHILELRCKADARGAKLWRAAAPEGECRELTMPDHGDLVCFLLELLGEALVVARENEGAFHAECSHDACAKRHRAHVLRKKLEELQS